MLSECTNLLSLSGAKRLELTFCPFPQLSRLFHRSRPSSFNSKQRPLPTFTRRSKPLKHATWKERGPWWRPDGYREFLPSLDLSSQPSSSLELTSLSSFAASQMNNLLGILSEGNPRGGIGAADDPYLQMLRSQGGLGALFGGAGGAGRGSFGDYATSQEGELSFFSPPLVWFSLISMFSFVL